MGIMGVVKYETLVNKPIRVGAEGMATFGGRGAGEKFVT
jgi:hypothetical protein